MSAAPPALAPRMLALQVAHHGGFDALRLGDLPRPKPGPGEVLIEMHASGMNHLDIWVRRGVPGHRFPLPLVLGSDGAGVVREVGAGIGDVAPGAEVILSPGTSCGRCAHCLAGRDPLCRAYGILGESRDGTAAEYACVPAANLLPKPAALGFVEASCFALATLTAWTMLVRRARLECGEEVLVLAGGSGVGSMAIQIAKLHGCRVIASAGGIEKCARLRDLGADEVIDHTQEDIAARVRELTGKRGVDVVVEHVGEATWQASLRSLARGGRLVTCGATSGARGECDLRAIFFKGLSILGSTMGSKGDLPRLVELVAAGRLRPVVGRVLPLSRAAEAQRLLEERQVFGKIVLVPDARLA